MRSVLKEQYLAPLAIDYDREALFLKETLSDRLIGIAGFDLPRMAGKHNESLHHMVDELLLRVGSLRLLKSKRT